MMPKEYPPIGFSIEEYPWCCGAEVVCNIDEDPYWEPPNCSLDYKTPVFKTKEEQLNSFLACLSKERMSRCLTMSFVQSYKGSKKQQIHGLKAHLLKNGWKVDQQFVNPNHGNTVCIMSKVFRAKKQAKPTGGMYGRW